MKHIQLGDILELNYGKSLRKDTRIKGVIPVYGSNGIVDYHSEQLLDTETIIVGRKGSIGEVHLVKGPCWPIDTTYYVSIKNSAQVIFSWLYRLLKTLRLQELNRSAAIPGLNREDVYRIKIPLPPLQDQIRIAHLLEKVEGLISKRKEDLAQLDVFLKSVFLEMFGDPVRNEKGWEKINWDHLFSTQTGKLNANAMVENGEYPFFTCAKESYRIDNYNFDCEALILAGNNASADYDVKYYNGKFNAYQRTYILNLLNSDSDYQFYRYHLEYKLGQLKDGSKGANTKYLTKQFLDTIEFIHPPKNEQSQFASIVNKIEGLKTHVQQSLTDLESLYGTLSQKAFAGELDLERVKV